MINAGSGISTDIWTSYTARIMAVSVLPFIIVQLSQMLLSDSGRRLAVLIALIISVLLLISYCLFQVMLTNKVSCPLFVLIVFIHYVYILAVILYFLRLAYRV